MKYVKPTIEVSEAQAAQMLAESLGMYTDSVDGNTALSQEDNAWDIWSDEEE